jgi:hypothetical protein
LKVGKIGFFGILRLIENDGFMKMSEFLLVLDILRGLGRE